MLQRFSHVIHITSTVSGRIKDGCDALDAIGATLPAGTLSGAPKIRALDILHGLEKSPRGVYGTREARSTYGLVRASCETRCLKVNTRKPS